MAKRIFRELAGGDVKNGKNAAHIWNGNNASSVTTRSEVIAMITNYFSRVENQTIQSSLLWNGSRPNDHVTDYELGIMIDRARNL